MLEISVKDGEYKNYPEGVLLQGLRSGYYTRFRKNEFFDIEPSQSLTKEQWQLFGEQMLRIEATETTNTELRWAGFPHTIQTGLTAQS